MKVYSITDINKFMKKLLVEECFNDFCLISADVMMAVSFHIDGGVVKEFFNSDEWEEDMAKSFILWKNIKNSVVQIVKGKRLPAGMKLVFKNSKYQDVFLKNNDEGIINIRYVNGTVNITTGISEKSFSMDKTNERIWEEWVEEFLKKNDIDFEKI